MKRLQTTLQTMVRSLRFQLTATIAVVLGLGLGALLIIAGTQMVNTTMDAFIHENEMSVLAVASSFPEPEEAFGRAALTRQRLQNSAARLGMVFTLLSSSGDILVNTANITPTLDDAAEVSAAYNGKISHAVRGKNLFIAVPLMHDGHPIGGVIWAETSTDLVFAQLNNQWAALIIATMITLGLATAVGWGLAERMIHPLLNIEQTARQMASGRLTVRTHIAGANSELASLGQSFNDMATEIEALVGRQREFVANAAHELRSPLAALKLRAEALAGGQLDPVRAQQYATDINEESSRLGQLVHDLLQLSRAEAHTRAAPTEPIELSVEVANCVRIIRPRLQVKQQQLTIDIPTDLPDLLIVPSDLQIIVGNLLDNAVKYTPERGVIEICARWAKGILELTVSDSGIGIPPADLPRVTERFFRADRAHSRHTPGAGLGLAIVQAIAQQYAGKVWLSSSGVVGMGTQAHLQLQVAAVSS